MQDPKRRKAIICDIDNTLANAEHRKHFLEGPKKNWDAFYEAMTEDIHYQWCIDLLFCMAEEMKAEIIYVTSRPKKYLSQTLKLINHPDLPRYNDLHMRPDGDYRPDTELKLEIYEKHIKGKYEVIFCLEDRASVTAMWRAQGLTVLQCAEGNF